MSFLASTALVASSGLSSLIDPVAKPIAAVLATIYSVVPNYGVAILVLSVLWMVLISPLTLKTTRSMLAMQKLQPQLKKLQEQHKNDRQAFAQAQMELFREHNASPFGACLPTLLPLPIFFALFRVINGLSHFHNGVPQYLGVHTRMSQDIVAAHGHLNAFGLDLSKNALSSHSSIWAALPFFILLLVMMGTQYLQSAQMMSRNPQAQNNPQAKMMKFLPLVFGVFCVQFPAGVVLYYAMSNLCRIGQQSAMYRYDPKVRALAAKDADEVEAITREIDEADKAKGRRKPGTGSSAKGGGGRTTESSAAPEPTQPSRGRFRDLLAQVSEQQSTAKAQAAERAAERQVAKERGPDGGAGTGSRPGGARKPQSSARKPSSTSGGSGTGRAKPGSSSNRPGTSSNRPGTSSKAGTSGKPGTPSKAGTGKQTDAKPAATGKVASGQNGAGTGAGNGSDGANGQSGGGQSRGTNGGNGGGTPRTAGNGNGDGGSARSGRTGAGAGSGSNRKRRGR